MARFLYSETLNFEIEKIIANAVEQLIIISPFIQLHPKVSNLLKQKKDNHELKMTIVFGKNEENMKKSMKPCDYEFFKSFPNIEIRYERDLHAKYYSNEFSSILTSMNLHAYSQKNNIEAGILFSSSDKKNPSNFKEESVEIQAIRFFKKVIEDSELLHRNTPNRIKSNFRPYNKMKSFRS